MNILDVIKPKRFKKTKPDFYGKDGIFQLKLSEGWFFSRTKNSYYFFAHKDLKGGFEISLVWNKPVNNIIESTFDYAKYIFESQINENEFVDCKVSDNDALTLEYKKEGSNLNYKSWFMKNDILLLHICYMIFEEEPVDVQAKWHIEVNEVIGSLLIDFAALKKTRMK